MSGLYLELPEYDALERALDALASVRAEVSEKQATLDALKIELMPYETALKQAKENERAAYEAVVQAALAVKDAHGDLNPSADVTIAIVSKLILSDEQAAIRWALDHNRLDLLKIELRSSKLLDAAKNGEVPADVARVEQDLQPRVSTKLGHRLLIRQSREGGA